MGVFRQGAFLPPGFFATFPIACDCVVGIEEVGSVSHITFGITRSSSEGDVAVPVITMVLPSECLAEISQQFAAGALLVQEDRIGKPIGKG